MGLKYYSSSKYVEKRLKTADNPSGINFPIIFKKLRYRLKAG